MTDNIFAHTAPGTDYPGYVSIHRAENGDVVVTVREEPTVREGVYICGFAADRGKPGRCTPGDDRCNNYCNMAPSKGKMQDRPAYCVQVFEGRTAQYTVPAAEWKL